jgi:hypothetical protein
MRHGCGVSRLAIQPFTRFVLCFRSAGACEADPVAFARGSGLRASVRTALSCAVAVGRVRAPGRLKIGLDFPGKRYRCNHPAVRPPAQDPAPQCPVVADLHGGSPGRRAPPAAAARRATRARARTAPRWRRTRSRHVPPGRCSRPASSRTRRRRSDACGVNVCFSSDTDAMRSIANVRMSSVLWHVSQQVERALGERQPVRMHEIVLARARWTLSDSASLRSGNGASPRAAGLRCRAKLAASRPSVRAWPRARTGAGRGTVASVATASFRAANAWVRSR